MNCTEHNDIDVNTAVYKHARLLDNLLVQKPAVIQGKSPMYGSTVKLTSA